MTNFFSQNGWEAFQDTSHFVRLETPLSNGFTQGWWCANDDVAVIFQKLIRGLDGIQAGIKGQLWSWNFRDIRGETTDLSNHASATAIDWNSKLHPQGGKNTFSSAQRIAIDAIVASLKVIRWGAHFVHAPED